MVRVPSPDPKQPQAGDQPAESRSGVDLRGGSPTSILALQRTAGNAAVGRVLARQAVGDDVKSSRRSVVVWEGERGKRVKVLSKLVIRAQVPAGASETLDAIVGSSEAENIRKKARALETEFIVRDWDLTPEALEQRMRAYGVRATLEFEPFDAGVTDKYSLPSINLMRFNAKFEWYVKPAVVELEISAALNPRIVLRKAERELLDRFEAKAKELREQMLELDKEKAELARAKQQTDAARNAVDRARADLADARTNAARELSGLTDEIDVARRQRALADEAVEQARRRRSEALRQLKAEHLDWDEFKRRSRELLDDSAKEIGELEKQARAARAAERSAERAFKAQARTLGRLEGPGSDVAIRRARRGVAKATALEAAIERKITRRQGTIKKLGQQAVDIAKQGKSWVFRKVVGPRLVKVLGLVMKAVPILNVISIALDVYDFFKLALNWDKVVPFGGGSDGGGGSGEAGAEGAEGTEGTGAGSKPGTGQGTGAAGSGTAGGTGPAGTDGGGGTGPAGTPGGTPGTGTGPPDGAGTGTGTAKQGGAGPGGKPGAGKGRPTAGKRPGGGKKAGKGGRPGGRPGGRTGARKGRSPGRAIEEVRAIPIQEAGPDDVDLFTAGARVRIEEFRGIDRRTAGKEPKPTEDVVTLSVEHDDRWLRVRGVPVVVVGRSERFPPRTPKKDRWEIKIDLEVTATLRLDGTDLVINKGDDLHYAWWGAY